MNPMILGLDGGGSKTEVRIARVNSSGHCDIVSRGNAGPSNMFAAGETVARDNLNRALDTALANAAEASDIDYAVLAVAGSGQREVQAFLQDWASDRAVARQVDIVRDTDPVLAAASPDGTGVALIVGTGSVAVGRDQSGQHVVTGGWGYWFGDAGSGYDLGRSALTALAHAVDGTGPGTVLVEHITTHVGVDNPRELLGKLMSSQDTRREIASLARVLLSCAAEGDPVAMKIAVQAARAAAEAVKVTIDKLDGDAPVPLAVAGSIVCHSELFRGALLAHLADLGANTGTVNVVRDPVEGSLLLAQRRLGESGRCLAH